MDSRNEWCLREARHTHCVMDRPIFDVFHLDGGPDYIKIIFGIGFIAFCTDFLSLRMCMNKFPELRQQVQRAGEWLGQIS